MVTYIVFWAALGLVVYAYAGFPLVLLVRGLLHRLQVRKAHITPPVTLIIVAHNEAATISAKLSNILELDYPREALDVIVASDGSDDGTDGIVRGFADRGIRLLACPRMGKIPALNGAVAHATGEVLVFSDANSMFARDALRTLVAPFADATVGAVGGNQRYLPEGGLHAGGLGERAYWSFDRLLKSMQSRGGDMTSATGAIHAIRRRLFRPVPLGVGDDFVISTRAISQGYRLVFEPNAVAYERQAPSDGAEFQRKLRVIVRGLRGLWAVRELFNPFRYGFYALQIASHKLLRWSVCWLLPILFVASLALAGAGAFYAFVAAMQVVFYLVALVGWGLRNSRVARARLFGALALPFYFCMANYAAWSAWMQVAAGRRVDVWDSHRSVGAHL